MQDISEENYKQGGYKEAGVKPKSFREIKSTALGTDRKLYKGKMGLRIVQKRQEKQNYLARNGKL